MTSAVAERRATGPDPRMLVQPTLSEADRAVLARLREAYLKVREQIARKVLGQDDVIEQLLVAFFAGGHVLLIGVPGLAKTMMVRSLAEVLDLKFSRIQFTPDLMPSDITGTDVIAEAEGQREFSFLNGPIFANLVLADEINRTPAKTQAALLEAMEEGTVHVGIEGYNLPRPFFVLATQNPIEQEGTYRLPAAALDRFMFNIDVDYPDEETELDIVAMTTSQDEEALDVVLSREQVAEALETIRRIPLSDALSQYAIDLVRNTRVPESPLTSVREWTSFGASPRAAQALILGAKARAALNGRAQVTPEDIRSVAFPVLRHRIMVNFHAESEKIAPDDLIREVLRETPRFSGDLPADDDPRLVPQEPEAAAVEGFWLTRWLWSPDTPRRRAARKALARAREPRRLHVLRARQQLDQATGRATTVLGASLLLGALGFTVLAVMLFLGLGVPDSEAAGQLPLLGENVTATAIATLVLGLALLLPSGAGILAEQEWGRALGLFTTFLVGTTAALALLGTDAVSIAARATAGVGSADLELGFGPFLYFNAAIWGLMLVTVVMLTRSRLHSDADAEVLAGLRFDAPRHARRLLSIAAAALALGALLPLIDPANSEAVVPFWAFGSFTEMPLALSAAYYVPIVGIVLGIRAACGPISVPLAFVGALAGVASLFVTQAALGDLLADPGLNDLGLRHHLPVVLIAVGFVVLLAGLRAMRAFPDARLPRTVVLAAGGGVAALLVMRLGVQLESAETFVIPAWSVLATGVALAGVVAAVARPHGAFVPGVQAAGLYLAVTVPAGMAALVFLGPALPSSALKTALLFVGGALLLYGATVRVISGTVEGWRRLATRGSLGARKRSLAVAQADVVAPIDRLAQALKRRQATARHTQSESDGDTGSASASTPVSPAVAPRGMDALEAAMARHGDAGGAAAAPEGPPLDRLGDAIRTGAPVATTREPTPPVPGTPASAAASKRAPRRRAAALYGVLGLLAIGAGVFAVLQPVLVWTGFSASVDGHEVGLGRMMIGLLDGLKAELQAAGSFGAYVTADGMFAAGGLGLALLGLLAAALRRRFSGLLVMFGGAAVLAVGLVDLDSVGGTLDQVNAALDTPLGILTAKAALSGGALDMHLPVAMSLAIPLTIAAGGVLLALGIAGFVLRRSSVGGLITFLLVGGAIGGGIAAARHTPDSTGAQPDARQATSQNEPGASPGER